MMQMTEADEIDIEGNQELIIKALLHTGREGIENLTDYLAGSNFFISPASTRFHNVCKGGLAKHSIEVTRLFSKVNHATGETLSKASVNICGLTHDLCKEGYYTETQSGTFKNVKGHPASKAHAKLSIQRIEQYIKLEPYEKDIILYHMGLFACYGKVIEYSPVDMYEAIKRNHMVQLFASCDMEESKRK